MKRKVPAASDNKIQFTTWEFEYSDDDKANPNIAPSGVQNENKIPLIRINLLENLALQSFVPIINKKNIYLFKFWLTCFF